MTPARPKHVPIRTCVACRQERPKRGLVRVVCSPQGVIGIDPTGKAAGRGAYLCPARECWELALKRKVLDHALRTALGADDCTRLQAYAHATFADSGLLNQ